MGNALEDPHLAWLAEYGNTTGSRRAFLLRAMATTRAETIAGAAVQMTLLGETVGIEHMPPRALPRQLIESILATLSQLAANKTR